MILLQSSLLSFGLTYGQENNHDKYLLVHQAFLVCKWLHKMGMSSSCAHWHLQVETEKHCLLDCIESQLVWQRLVRIFANYFSPLGIVVWTSLVGSIFHYDNESMDHGFHTNSGSVRVLPLMSMQCLGLRKELQPL